MLIKRYKFLKGDASPLANMAGILMFLPLGDLYVMVLKQVM